MCENFGLFLLYKYEIKSILHCWTGHINSDKYVRELVIERWLLLAMSFLLLTLNISPRSPSFLPRKEPRKFVDIRIYSGEIGFAITTWLITLHYFPNEEEENNHFND